MSSRIDITTLTQEERQDILDTKSIREMLRHYILTADFCVRYILTTDEYAFGVEDSYHDIYDVLIYQDQLTMEDLQNAYVVFEKEKEGGEKEKVEESGEKEKVISTKEKID